VKGKAGSRICTERRVWRCHSPHIAELVASERRAVGTFGRGAAALRCVLYGSLGMDLSAQEHAFTVRTAA